MKGLTPEQAAKTLAWLRDPRNSLPKFGYVQDGHGSSIVPYKTDRMTHHMNQDILDYIAEPPVLQGYMPDDLLEEESDVAEGIGGYTMWMTVLKARQTAGSTTVEYGLYPKAAYTPGWDHVCIADTNKRANYLHGRVHVLHDRWDLEIRPETAVHGERRQLTFAHLGQARIISAEDKNVGIGQSPDSLHVSEGGFMDDFNGVMFNIYPSIRNRANCRVIFECTPKDRDSDWHQHCLMTQISKGRHFYKFYPFWDGKLNRRKWQEGDTPTQEELSLLNRYGHLGLTLEHIAFRRVTMDEDGEIRRRPEMFAVFYPFDDLTCWASNTSAAIPDRVLKKHEQGDRCDIIDWDVEKEVWHRFEDPKPGATYTMGVDPSGGTVRDHGSFRVLKVWAGHWEVVYSYDGWSDQIEFTDKMIEVAKEYNNAKLVIGREGVGMGILTLARARGYQNILSDRKGKLGIHVTGTGYYAHGAVLNWLIDALLDNLVIPDKPLIRQLQTYRRDKELEESEKAELLRGGPAKSRRPKGHWDGVSALMMGVIGARSLPQRTPPWVPIAPEPTSFPPKLTWTKAEVTARMAEVVKTPYNSLTRKAGLSRRVSRPVPLRRS